MHNHHAARRLYDQLRDLKQDLRQAQRRELREGAARLVDAAAVVMEEAYWALDRAYGNDPNDEAVGHAQGLCGEWDCLRQLLTGAGDTEVEP